jgi:hypothetical protein
MAQKKGSTNFDAKPLVIYSKRKPTDGRERTGFAEKPAGADAVIKPKNRVGGLTALKPASEQFGHSSGR